MTKKRKPSKKELHRLYLKDKISLGGIAKEYEVGETTVMKWCDSYEIKRRNKSEAISLARANIQWPDVETWKEYGLIKGYNERNSKSLERSDNKDERSWYSRGLQNKWVTDFTFKRLIKKRGFWQVLENVEIVLKEYMKETSEFPTERALEGRYGQGLTNAINRYYGGLKFFRERMGYVKSSENGSLLETYVGGNSNE